MSLNLDRSTWKLVKLGDVVLRSRIQVDPVDGGVDRYVAGGHVDTDSVIIQRSGDVADGEMGSTFRYLFKPGQVLFVSARPYLRKVGVPDFAGVVADKTYVLDAAPGNGLIHDVLPFLLTSDRFVEYANREATGSMNPRLLWGAMQRYEFHLPPIDDQKRIADLLWDVERYRASLGDIPNVLAAGYDAWLEARLESVPTVPLDEVAELQHGRPVPSSLYGKGDFPLLRPGDMNPDGSVSWSSTSARIPQVFVNQNAGWILNPGDLVINMTAQTLEDRFLGRVCRMSDQALLNQRIGRLTAKGLVTLDFTFVALHSAAFAEWVSHKSEGSKVKHMHWRHIADYPIPVPSPEEQAAIVSEAVRWAEATNGSVAEYSSLSALRSSLLADIFRGN